MNITYNYKHISIHCTVVSNYYVRHEVEGGALRNGGADKGFGALGTTYSCLTTVSRLAPII